MRDETIHVHKISLPARLHRVSIDEDALRDLIASIATQGLINAISVKQLDLGFELVAGHRRLLAHQRTGHTHIAAHIYEPGDAINPDAIRFAENLHREPLSPMEEGRAIRDYINEFPDQQEAIARMLHRSPDWIEQRLALLTLPDELAVALHTKRLGIAHALCLAQVEDAEHRAYLLRYALDAGATVVSLREWVHHWKTAHAAGAGATAPRPELPEPGQPVIVLIPCWICAKPLPYQTMRILRTCPDCAQQIAGAGVEASLAAAHLVNEA